MIDEFLTISLLKKLQWQLVMILHRPVHSPKK